MHGTGSRLQRLLVCINSESKPSSESSAPRGVSGKRKPGGADLFVAEKRFLPLALLLSDLPLLRPSASFRPAPKSRAATP